MLQKNRLIIFSILLCAMVYSKQVSAQNSPDRIEEKGVTLKKADKPLFVDPIYNGSTDPMVCFNYTTNRWYMYYTSRRANMKDLNGIEAIHGSEIGIAASTDGGATWEYIGNCNIDYRPHENPTYWAPEIIEHEGLYHMYLTYVPGVFDDWNHPREIVHLTSKDGINWEKQSVLALASNNVIDACIFQMPNGIWRLWYNNEADHKSIYYAESTDLYTWKDMGKVDIETIGEGPNVIFWHNKYYMFVDEWKGLSVFSSDDAINWKKQDKYLISGIPVNKEKDVLVATDKPKNIKLINGTKGNHADIEISNNRAYMFYFSHLPEDGNSRKTSVYVQELLYHDSGIITCDALSTCYINLNEE